MTNRVLRALAAAVGALAALVVPIAAHADPLPPSTESWRYEATAYGWLPALTGDIGVNPAVPPVHVDLSPWDVISSLRFGFMGRFEARKDRFVGFADIVYANTGFSKHITIRDRDFGSASIISKPFFNTDLAGYRALETPTASLDLLAGLRFVNIDTGLDLVGPRRTFDAGKPAFWVDPLLGARMKYKLARKWDATVWGDFGGFGAGSQFTGEVEGTVAYRFARRWSAFAGWRYLYTDYDRNGFVFNTDMNGPELGATYRF
jgi:hypothetical protein